MTSHAEAATCPQCGAPLELDENGRCAWCHATIRVQPEARAGYGTTAVTDSAFFDLCDSPLDLPAPSGLLSALWMLGKDQRVYREFLNPAFLAEVRILTSRVQAATERAQGNGLGESEPNWMQDYTVDELWCFRLARDLTVWLATLDGVTREHNRLALETAADACDWGRRVGKALENYGDGPGELRGLRARIPLAEAAGT